jgi:hypothetical protein
MSSTKIALGLMLAVSLGTTAWGIFEHRRNTVMATTVAALQSQEAELRRQVEQQQKQLQVSTSKLNEALRQKMPVSVLFMPAAAGKGRAVVFKNNAPEPVEVGVVIFNPANSRRRESQFTIQGMSTQSISESQGWTLAGGQHIKLTHAAYGSVDYTVPE